MPTTTTPTTAPARRSQSGRFLHIRITEPEAAAFTAAAKAEGQSLSEWVRDTLKAAVVRGATVAAGG